MARFTVLIAAVILAFVVAVPEVTAKKYTVGENKFWNPNINYTIWAQGKHFYLGDWLCMLSLSQPLLFLYIVYTLGSVYIRSDSEMGFTLNLVMFSKKFQIFY